MPMNAVPDAVWSMVARRAVRTPGDIRALAGVCSSWRAMAAEEAPGLAGAALNRLLGLGPDEPCPLGGAYASAYPGGLEGMLADLEGRVGQPSACLVRMEHVLWAGRPSNAVVYDPTARSPAEAQATVDRTLRELVEGGPDSIEPAIITGAVVDVAVASPGPRAAEAAALFGSPSVPGGLVVPLLYAVPHGEEPDSDSDSDDPDPELDFYAHVVDLSAAPRPVPVLAAASPPRRGYGDMRACAALAGGRIVVAVGRWSSGGGGGPGPEDGHLGVLVCDGRGPGPPRWDFKHIALPLLDEDGEDDPPLRFHLFPSARGSHAMVRVSDANWSPWSGLGRVQFYMVDVPSEGRVQVCTHDDGPWLAPVDLDFDDPGRVFLDACVKSETGEVLVLERGTGRARYRLFLTRVSLAFEEAVRDRVVWTGTTPSLGGADSVPVLLSHGEADLLILGEKNKVLRAGGSSGGWSFQVLRAEGGAASVGRFAWSWVPGACGAGPDGSIYQSLDCGNCTVLRSLLQDAGGAACLVARSAVVHPSVSDEEVVLSAGSERLVVVAPVEEVVLVLAPRVHRHREPQMWWRFGTWEEEEEEEEDRDEDDDGSSGSD